MPALPNTLIHAFERTKLKTKLCAVFDKCLKTTATTKKSLIIKGTFNYY